MAPTKFQYYAELADQQARQITGSREDWTGFLETAGRLYKYPFDEQLMIYAQRPNATACAPLATWNKPLNRYVKRGSKGIALIDNSANKPRLRYVFDYTDTEDGRYNSRRPFIWQMKPEHEPVVVEALDKAYDMNKFMGWDSFNGRAMIGNDIGDVIFGLAHELAARYYYDNARDIGYAVEGSFLESNDEFNISVAFQEALTVSAAYSIMTRCSIDPAEFIRDEDFQSIFDFNTPDSVYTLGKAVSNVTEEVLREIEVTIKKYERQQTADLSADRQERSTNHGRDNLQQGRELSGTRYSDTGKLSAGQIRHDAEELPQGSPPDTVQPVFVGGEAVSPLPGNRRHGERTAGTDDEPIAGAKPAARQNDRPDGLGGAHEQPQSPSGGNNLRRTDLQLEQNNGKPDETPSDKGGGSLFPPKVEQKPPLISQDIIDNALRGWNGDTDRIRRVFDYMAANGRSREAAAFLRSEFGKPEFCHKRWCRAITPALA